MPLKSNQLDPAQLAAIHRILESICRVFGMDVAVLFLQGPGQMEALSVGSAERFKPIAEEIIDAVLERSNRRAEEAATRN